MTHILKNAFYSFEVKMDESSRVAQVRLDRNIKLLITDYLKGDPAWDAYRELLREFPSTVPAKVKDGDIPDWPAPPEDLPGLNLME
tara:strand:+ start:522 stop:779 length:258 start_codon:yes stop_codon:yes gene_type:complete